MSIGGEARKSRSLLSVAHYVIYGAYFSIIVLYIPQNSEERGSALERENTLYRAGSVLDVSSSSMQLQFSRASDDF